MKKNAFDPVRVRIWALTGLMGLCLVAFAGVMYYTQILHGEENRAKSLASNAASETVEASRGIITDRNGKVLVSNRLTYTLIFSAKEFDTDQELNAAILRLTDLCTENGTAWNDTLPVSRTAPYSYTDPADGEGFALFLKNKDIPYSTLSQVTPTLQPDRFMAKLRQLFNIDDSYTEDQARTIAGVRYELAVKSLTDAQYVFADDVSVELISQTADGVLPADGGMYLLFQQGRDRVSSILFAAQTVEKHRTLHRCKGHRLEFFLQGIPGRLHQGGVEGPAHLQRQAAPCTGLCGQCSGLVNSDLVAADDQLAGAVVVADLYNACIGSGVAAALQGIAVQSQHGGHAAAAPGCGCSHGFPAEGRQCNGSAGIKYARAGQR